MAEIQVGDQFQDLDGRNVGPRVVEVRVSPYRQWGDLVVDVMNIEHWKESLIGRYTTIRVDRLTSKKFKKVSR